MSTVICYGDSNTWGYDPRGIWGGRYDEPWPGILQRNLNWKVINLGANGRCLPRSGREYRVIEQALELEYPVKMAIVMIGTNDILAGRKADPAALLDFLRDRQRNLDILLLPPPPIALPEFSEAAEAYSARCRELALSRGLRFCDTRDLPLAFDGVHLTEEGHRLLAQRLTEQLWQLRD